MNSFSDYLAQGNAWLFIPAAILLGALHGLEPGHSKTMMAAFIVAIRGTIAQAALLGLSATISHTAIVWALAFVGLHYSGRFDVETTEPYFQLATGVIVIGMAAWMFVRNRRMQQAAANHHHTDHGPSAEFKDDHEREHAAELQKRFANQQVTTGQLIMFGLTGGLLPCPSAFAVLLICLQLKRYTLGFALVLAFSLGLAITLVTVGSVAAISVRHAGKRFKGFGEFARKLPYASCTLMTLIGLFIAFQGLQHLIH